MLEGVSLLHLIDFILILMIGEIAVLAWRAKRARSTRLPAPSLARFLPTMLSGFFLVMAMRMILSEAGAQTVMACLTASLIAHLADLWRMHKR